MTEVMYKVKKKKTGEWAHNKSIDKDVQTFLSLPIGLAERLCDILGVQRGKSSSVKLINNLIIRKLLEVASLPSEEKSLTDQLLELSLRVENLQNKNKEMEDHIFLLTL